MYRYKFHNSDNKVIALGSFAGKVVRGIAKCDPEDTFSLEDGKELAKARCEAKIAHKREKYACDKLEEAYELFSKAQEHFEQMNEYWEKAHAERIEADKTVKEIFERLNSVN